MFTKLTTLVHSLQDCDFKVYNNSAKTRKILSDIKKECDRLRLEVLTVCKEANPKIFKQ